MFLRASTLENISNKNKSIEFDYEHGIYKIMLYNNIKNVV